jgi:hypothetical protein
MTLNGLFKLAVDSIGQPREVAHLLLAMRPSNTVLMEAFALMVTLNAVLFSLSVLAFPSEVELPVLFKWPFLFAAIQALVLGGTIAALTWTGRLFGGTGRIEDIAVLLIWMQALRVAVQAVMLVLSAVAPAASALLALGASGVGIWILLNFLDEAHGLGGLGKAFAVMFLGILGLGFALAILLTFTGGAGLMMTEGMVHV